ncbi:MAG: beta-hydroxyacyl-ACP dehydratase [Pirellulales bacterium]|nr:beta-hydroxyacyl-ACP dehydratase [Pirellulales bacterium]
MRWFWLDRFTEFESGRRATAVKNVSLAEEHMHDHFPGVPLAPHSLVIEGIAQTGGLLVGEWSDWQERVILAKIAKAKFHGYARPGDTLIYHAEIVEINDDGALTTATSHRQAPDSDERELHAEVEMFFAHLSDAQDQELFYTCEFATMLRGLRIFDVGKTADGEPLEMPEPLHKAELLDTIA